MQRIVPVCNCKYNIFILILKKCFCNFFTYNFSIVLRSLCKIFCKLFTGIRGRGILQGWSWSWHSSSAASSSSSLPLLHPPPLSGGQQRLGSQLRPSGNPARPRSSGKLPTFFSETLTVFKLFKEHVCYCIKWIFLFIFSKIKKNTYKCSFFIAKQNNLLLQYFLTKKQAGDSEKAKLNVLKFYYFMLTSPWMSSFSMHLNCWWKLLIQSILG